MISEKLVLKDYKPYSKLVADAYAARPDYETEHVHSWKSLIAHTEKMFKQIQSKVNIEFVDEDPYKSFDEMKADIEKTGTMKVWKGASDHPVWTPEQNWKFRAVHDYMVHIAGGHKFTLRGEIGAYNRHAKTAPPDALTALYTEVVAQVCYYEINQSFASQKICKIHGVDYIQVGKVDEQEYQNNFQTNEIYEGDEKVYSSDDVMNFLDSITTDDYLDNQYYDIGMFDNWRLKKIRLSDLDFTRDNVSSPDSQELLNKYKDLTTEAPPIIVVPRDEGLLRIVDGYHRVAIADLKGQDSIMAYVPELESIGEDSKEFAWFNQPDLEAMDNVPYMTDEQQDIALSALAQETKFKNQEERKYLLYRGVSESELKNIQNNIYTNHYRSAWTPKKSVAEHFGKDRLKQGFVLSGWVPESAIVYIPKHFLKWPGSSEYEVLVEKGADIEIVSLEETGVYPGNESKKHSMEKLVDESYNLFEAAKISGINYQDYLALLLFTDAFLDVVQKEHPGIAEKVTEPGIELVESVWNFFEKSDLDIWTFVDRRPAYKMIQSLNQLWSDKLTAEDLVRFDDSAFAILALQAVGRDVSLEDNKKVKTFLADRGASIPTTKDLGIELDTKRYEAAYKAVEALKDKETDGITEDKEHPYIRQAYDLLRMSRNKVDPKRSSVFDRILFDLEEFL